VVLTSPLPFPVAGGAGATGGFRSPWLHRAGTRNPFASTSSSIRASRNKKTPPAD